LKLEGPRIWLRPFGDADPSAIEPWFKGAAAIAYGQTEAGDRTLQGEIEDARKDGAGDFLVIAWREDPMPLGVLGYRVGYPEARWLTIGFIAMAPGERGRGCGSEAVRLLEKWAIREAVAERFRANVSIANGLGLYFWLRLGYRPASAEEFDWQRDEVRDKMPMVRSAV
jgi:RimJ/RimL family protein N-acetyltransferase